MRTGRRRVLLAAASAQAGPPLPTTALWLAGATFKLENAAPMDDRVDFTAMGWVRLDGSQAAGHEYIVWNVRAGASGELEDIEVTNDPPVVSLFAQRAGATTINVLGATAVGLDTWVHLGVVRASGIVTAYLNGVAQGNGTQTRGPGDAAPTVMRFGSWNGDTGYLFGGLFGWKFWTAALSGAEITAEMAQILPARAANHYATFLLTGPTDLAEKDALIAAWTLTGAPGTIAPPAIPWTA